MSNIFESIEKDSFENLKQCIKLDSNCLELKNEDGYTALNLCIQYEMNDFVEYILNESVDTQINTKIHPVVVAIKNENKQAFDMLLNHKKTDLSTKDKAGENFLFHAFYHEDKYYFNQLINKKISVYENNNMGHCIFSSMIQHQENEFFQNFVDSIQNNYQEVFVKNAIKYKNNVALDALLEHSQLEKEELFNTALDFENIYAVSQIIHSEGFFIPGFEQVKSMISLICTQYTSELEKKAASNIINYLFDINVPFNKFVDKSGKSAWMLSIENDNIEVFDKLVKTTQSANTQDNQSHSPLMYAIQLNKPEFVSLLLKKKADYNHVDIHKDTPLIKAVRTGNLDIVKELLKYPIHVNEMNKNNESALNLSVKNKRMDIVSVLIWAGGEIVNNPTLFSETKDVFHFNINGQYEKLLTYQDEKNVNNFLALGQLGFNLNQINEEGDSFLIHFIKNGFLANFKTLLKCSLNPNQTDQNNNTPVMCAVNKNKPIYLESLLNRFDKIDLNLKNSCNENVYDLCIKHQRTDNRMSLLVKYDDNLSVENAKKSIFYLAKNGFLEENWDKLQNVLKSIHIKDHFENTLLMLCISGNNKKDFDFLLNNNLVGNLKEENNNKQNIFNMIELLPEEKKLEYKQSILYYSHQNNNLEEKKNT